MKKIILASASPRRQQFFKELHFDYEVILKPIDETYPNSLQREQITDYLSKKKAEPFYGTLKENDVLITSDTIVWHEGKALGKPKDYDDGFEMLKSLSGKQHEVITSVCFTTSKEQKLVNCVTKVTFKTFTDREIDFYLKEYKPYDKAGAYGIQEWIGYVGVTAIEGSYNNVIGLPTHLVYSVLEEFENAG
ncbi:Maf-like protein [Capnocytophaga felis]|uniref:dTTP/UTP pyrophosphatase n=1 Tax=Capnocytophaga felis TaxID=2267611 RepID=A0A5M4B5X9_9FLAO|nr:Maf-like protein [Capnocytophaga felis]GET45021.1 Maf-like protein [Capnocytophaga felis]GET47816.1 Maf-like protein [Capnocytophaga felis]